MAGNNIYVQGSYVDIHDNEVVNLSVDKAQVRVGDQQVLSQQSDVPEVLADSEQWQKVRTCQGTVLWQVFIRRFEKIQRNNTAKIEIIQREPCR